MNIECVIVGPFEVNCWIVWGVDGQAIVIDPGGDPPHVLAALKDNGLSVAAYVLTHGHIDHISALMALHAGQPAPVALHSADAVWAFEEVNKLPPFYNALTEQPPIERSLAHGQEWCDAGLSYHVIETPGHTPGSVCLLFPEEQVLFSGDTLFAGSIGRTDLPGGDGQVMRESLKRIAAIDDVVRVYPGHGPTTDMAREKRTNFFLRA